MRQPRDEIEASPVDIDRQFEEASRVLSNGLHQLYWRTHAERDALEAKVEVILLAGDAGAMKRLEGRAEALSLSLSLSLS